MLFSVYYMNHNNILIKMLSEKLLAIAEQFKSTFVATNCLFNNNIWHLHSLSIDES